MEIKRPLSKQPIPAHAERVFKGEIFEVYHWQQPLFDGSTATFEKIKRADTVGVIPITAAGKLIISRQAQPGTKPYLGTLGGRIDEGESPEAAAKRELLEESGLVAETLTLWSAEQIMEKIDWAIYTFVAKGCRQVAEQTLDAGEDISLMEVTFDEFLNIVATEEFRDHDLALRVLRQARDPQKLLELRQLLSA